MIGLVMAGGRGTRLGCGEKPLVPIAGTPMILWVLTALYRTHLRPIYGSVTAYTPQTATFLEKEGVYTIHTSGKGFIEDMREAIMKKSLSEEVLVISADIPLITPGILTFIKSVYDHCDHPALAVYTTRHFYSLQGIEKEEEISPAGINILSGRRILDNPEAVQPEYRLIIDRIEVALNINTKKDLEYLKTFYPQYL
jgi:adenosylcobinamide-phosphate guanylyltransferase